MLKSFSKLSRKSESMVEANRILKFIYDPELMVVSANVQASLRDRNYKIKGVSIKFAIYADLNIRRCLNLVVFVCGCDPSSINRCYDPLVESLLGPC